MTRMKHSSSSLFARAGAASALVLALACSAVGPDHVAPERAVPAAWTAADGDALSGATAELTAWWQRFDDTVLDELVARAVHGSLDLREALARIREARALRGFAAGERFPTVDGTAGWRRSGESDNTPFGPFVPDHDITSLGFDAAWELDLWGRVRRSVEAADAELAATVEDARFAAVTVAAEVAREYVDLRAFQRRLALARTNVELQEQTLDLVRGRFESGLVAEIDVAQARTNVESTRSFVPALEAGVSITANRIAVLLGEAPGALASLLGTEAPVPVPPLAFAVGVPADLLRRRADVRAAERILAAEVARIGVTEAERYPQVSLLGNIGVAAEDVDDLFESASGLFGIGPSLRWTLFDGGRLRARVAAQEARTEQALVRWERTVLLALEESEDAMTRFVREQSRRASLLEAAAQARLSVELARSQYTEGLSDFQAVLVSERSLAELEDALASSEAAVATHLVALYKALGGGWEEGPLAESLAGALAAR
jgi:NodT family efflux transporter outer membrane factor (OMF) lipoprotein